MSLSIRRFFRGSAVLLLVGASAGVLAAVVSNLAPVFDSTPYPVAEVGQTYRYTPHANDPEGNALTYSLTQAVPGMAWSSSDNAAMYTPTEAQIGSGQVTVQVRDSWGAATSQTYPLRTVADFCEIYPITVPQSLVANVRPGDEFTLVPRGSMTGNFSWLTWTGATDAPTLAGSLTAPGNSYNYANPSNPMDRLLEIGDWAQGATGSMNAWPVREQMDRLKTRDIVIPTWDANRAAGADFDYHVANFAVVRIRQYDLSGPGAISFEFRGYKDCYNDAPIARDVEVTTPEDTAVAVTLDATDPENDALTYTIVGQPAHGTLSGEGATLTYTPAADYFGTDSFTYRARDAEFDSNLATVTIHVTPVNDPPVALDRTATTAEDTPVAVTLQGTDPENDALTYVVIDAPANGTLEGEGAALTYTPNENWSGEDVFTYRVNDGALDSNVATVRITVTPVNDAPLAHGQAVATDEDTPLAIMLSGSDPEGDALTFTLRQRTAHGELVGDGANWEYRPARDFFGTDQFTFIVNDGELDSEEATVFITVREKNAPPVATDLYFETLAGEPVTIVLTGSDPDGDTLGFRPINTPAHGVLSGIQPNLLFEPDAGFIGTVAFQYVAIDGRLESSPATVTIVVSASDDNQPPRIVSTPSNFFDEHTTYGYDLDALDPDADDVLTYTADRSPAGLSVDPQSGLLASPTDGLLVGGVRETNLACRAPAPRHTFDPILKWGRGEETASEVDPTEIVRGILGPALVAQLTDDNDDGRVDSNDGPDVIVTTRGTTGTTDGTLIVLDGATGETKFSKVMPYLAMPGTPAVADVDGDGLMEIAVLESQYAAHMSLLENDGTLKWRVAIPAHQGGSDQWSRDAIAIHDLDGDGTPELIRGRTIVNANGTVRCTGTGDKGGPADYGWIPTVADLDLDGKQEIIAGRTIYNSQCGIVRTLAAAADGYTAIGNFDNDDQAEIVLVTNGTMSAAGRLYLFNHDGTQIFGNLLIPGNGPGGPATLANVDDDPYPEIGIANKRRYTVYDHTGAVLWGHDTQELSSGVTGSTFFDFEGDGFPEMVYADEQFVYFWDGRTGALRYSFGNISDTTLEYPVIADLDGDGSAEVITGFNDLNQGNRGGIRVIASSSGSWSNARPLWNQHAFSLTNINDDGTIPRQPVPSWLAHNTYRLNKLSKGESLGQADLALFDLRLDPSDTTTIRLTATNRGLAPTGAATLVRIYDGTDDSGRLLGTVPLPVLEIGESIPVALHKVNAHALGDSLYATIDEVQAVAECDDLNNAMQARVFHLRATDRGGLFDRQVTTTAVLDRNDAPSFLPAGALGTPRIGQFFTQTVKATDPDRGDGLVYSIQSAPVGVEIEPVSGEIRWKPTSAQAGAQTVVVKVTDLRGLSNTQSLTFTVPANHTPVFTSTALNKGTKGVAYFYDANATDSDGDLLTYSLTAKPTGMTIEPQTGGVNWTPSTTGNFSVTIRVTDANGSSATQSYTIAVTNPVNHAPVFDTQPLTVVALGQQYRYDAHATDPDGHTIQYLMLQAPAGMTVDVTTGTIVWQPRTDQVGAHAVQLQAKDAPGLAVVQSFTVYVTQGVDTGNHPPSIRSLPATSHELGEDYAYTVATEDIDGDTVTVTLGTAPAGMTFTDGTLRWTPTAAQVGTHTVSLTATDGNGGLATQTWSIVVWTSGNGGGTPPAANRPPSITTDPLTLVALGQTYRYYPSATDPDGDTLAWSLLSAPAGMTVNATTGVLAWTPPATGTYAISLRVSDNKGGSALQSYTLVVNTASAPINHRPILLSTPATQGKVGKPYCDTLEAFDADGDPITFTLESSPVGATIDANGRVCWTPERIGTFPLAVRISDGQAWTDFGWSIAVADAEAPLIVGVVVTPERVAPGAPVTIIVGIEGPTGPVQVDAEINGTDIVLDDDGTTLITAPTTPGYYQIVVTVTDGESTDTDTTDLFVADPTDVTPPAVSLASPVTDQRVTAPTPVLGQVSGDGIARWTLSLLDKSTNSMTPIAEGHAAAGPGMLGTLDPTLLSNGYYAVVLQAWDASGNVASDSRTVLIDGQMKLGHFSITFEDVSIPMGGMPLTMTRTYDTRRRNERLDFGYGWSVDYQNLRITESRPAGFSWTQQSERNGYFGNWCVRPNGDPIVAVTLPDGELLKFRAKAMPECQFLTPQSDVQLVYEPLPGTNAKLAQTDYQTVRLAQVAGSGVYNLLDLSDPYLAPVDPKNYKLTLPDGSVYTLTQGVGLRQVRGPDGQTLTYSKSGVKHSLGQELKFLRDGQGRIEQVVLPDGKKLLYTYQPTGDLEMAIDQGGDITSFAYLPNAPHYLKDIVDPRGVRVSRNEYDDNGRLVATIDADGHRIEYSHDLGNRTEIIKDRRGNASTYGYDNEGRVIAESNALGETTLHEYDLNGNELETTDPLGHTTTRTFDARGNLLTETNHLGETITRTFNERNQVLTVKDPLGRVMTTNTYNPYNGYLVTTKNAAGEITTFGYDSGIGTGGTGTMNGVVAADGQRSRFILDMWGHPIREIDHLGNESAIAADFHGRIHGLTRYRTTTDGAREALRTVYQLDDKDRVVSTTFPDNSVTTVEYDGNDRPIKACDALRRCTTTIYLPRGQVGRVEFPDGTYETTEYDENGNPIAQRSRGGRVTKMIYDKANRLVETILPDATPGTDNDNPRTYNEYDAAGRLTATVDARHYRTEYGYDDANRRTSVKDALGRVTTTGYDDAGQQTYVVDALGRTTRFEYDSAGRLRRTIFPDSTTSTDDNPFATIEYDAAGRKIAETDEMGRLRAFAYDKLGRLETVTLPNPLTGVHDSGALVTRYGYDEVGNKLTQTDARGRVTRWAYDRMGREVSRTLPLGQTETFGYDAAGQRVRHVDFKGNVTAFGYDDAGRLDVVDHESDPDVFTTYLPSGQRGSVTDGQGTTLYTYTARGQLASVSYPDGQSITYAYDAAGNRTELHSAAQDQVFTFDALNRLEDVTTRVLGGPARVVHHEYDEVGNRKLLRHANGVTTTTLYDERNRLASLVTRTAAGVVLFGATYQVDASGLRIGIGEYDASGMTRAVGYDYDADKRLTAEIITYRDRPTRTATYEYDPVGNRTRRLVNGTPTTYIVDDNDRLTHETQGGVSTVRTYDDNGNTTNQAKPGELLTFEYDESNRLVANTVNGIRSESGYNADGIRNRQTTAGATTKWLIDPNRDFAQTLEASESGQLITTWQFGDDLISQVNLVGGSARERVLLADGTGSVRKAVDETGLVSDSFEYDAYGEELSRTGASEIDHRYRAEQLDPATGFYNLRARQLDPTIGRFLTQDSFTGAPTIPQSHNLYAYAHGDPVQFADPSGHSPLMNSLIATTVGSILANTAVSAYGISRASAGGTADPDGLLVSLRLLSAGGRAGYVGLNGSVGLDIVIHRASRRFVVYASFEGGVSPGFINFKGSKLSGPSWGLGAIWNMQQPSDLKGLGMSATWPGMALSGLCSAAHGSLAYTTALKFSCRAGGRVSRTPLNFSIGFSAPAGPGFVQFGTGKVLSTNLLGWSQPIADETNPVYQAAKEVVDQSGVFAAVDQGAEALVDRIQALDGM
jgi:RHS repeat-associated protein